MTGNNKHLSILTLNVNGINAPIKRHRIANRVKKTIPSHMLLTRLISLNIINTGLESKGRRKFSKQMNPIIR
jgi:hypothetical protein